MGIKWTDEQIKTLLIKARDLYETDIPLMNEITKTNVFINDMFQFAGPNDTFKFKLNWLRFSWSHRGWEKNVEIIIPEDVAWKVFNEARDIVDKKCNRLNKMLGDFGYKENRNENLCKN